MPIGHLFLFFNETIFLLSKRSTLGNSGGFCLRRVGIFEIDIFKDGQGILILFYFGNGNEQFDDYICVETCRISQTGYATETCLIKCIC